MTDIILAERFEKFEDDYLKFEKIENPFSRRRDLCAFLLLDSLLDFSKADRNILRAAEPDIIYFDVDPEYLNSRITDDQILYLARCGVMCDDEFLTMFA